LEDRTVHTIAVDRNLCKISINGVKPVTVLKIIRTLAANEVPFENVTQVSGGETDSFSFSIHETDYRRTADILTECRMERTAEIVADKDLAMLSVSGDGVAYDSRIASLYYDTLHQENVEIYILSLSERKISALVNQHAADRAAAYLRARFMEAGVYGPVERTVKSHEKKENFHRLRGSGDYSLYRERNRFQLVQENIRLSAGKRHKGSYSLRNDGGSPGALGV